MTSAGDSPASLGFAVAETPLVDGRDTLSSVLLASWPGMWPPFVEFILLYTDEQADCQWVGAMDAAGPIQEIGPRPRTIVISMVGAISGKSLKLLPPCRYHIVTLNFTHRVRFWLGLHSRPCSGSLQRSPDSLAGFTGPILIRERKGRERNGSEGQRGST